MAPRWDVVMVNALDAERQAAFWGALLETEVRGRWHHFIGLHPTVPGGPRLVFQRVDELDHGQRLHLDLHVPDLEEASQRAETLGARRVRDVELDAENWRIMTDPEGNVFCFVLDHE
jgi:glyoxalase superfamily protein